MTNKELIEKLNIISITKKWPFNIRQIISNHYNKNYSCKKCQKIFQCSSIQLWYYNRLYLYVPENYVKQVSLKKDQVSHYIQLFGNSICGNSGFNAIFRVGCYSIKYL